MASYPIVVMTVVTVRIPLIMASFGYILVMASLAVASVEGGGSHGAPRLG